MASKLVLHVTDKSISFNKSLFQKLTYSGVMVKVKNGHAVVINCDDGIALAATSMLHAKKFDIEKKESNYGYYELARVNDGLFEGDIICHSTNEHEVFKLANSTPVSAEMMYARKSQFFAKDNYLKSLKIDRNTKFNVVKTSRPNIIVLCKNRLVGRAFSRSSNTVSKFLYTKELKDFAKSYEDIKFYTNDNYIVLKGL